MTTFVQRLRRVPASTSGRVNHDALLIIADACLSGLWALSGAFSGALTSPPVNSRSIPLRVTKRVIVAEDEDVVALTLSGCSGQDLWAWRPGAHIDLRLPSGRIRQYSLCGNLTDRKTYRIAVRRIRDGGGGSVEIHDSLRVGSVVETTGPRNAFPLSLPGYGSFSRRVHFVAGGIGITPILPMVQQAEAFGVEWSLQYVGRTRESMAFADELDAFGDKVDIRTDDDAGVPTARQLLTGCDAGTAIYACGPAPMLSAIEIEVASVNGAELHFERFCAPPVIDGHAFAATLAKTGGTIEVQAGETLLSALLRNGVDVPYSCRQGFCGTCRAKVLDGTVDHRDVLLTSPEREAGSMLLCVSRGRASEPLILEL